MTWSIFDDFLVPFWDHFGTPKWLQNDVIFWLDFWWNFDAQNGPKRVPKWTQKLIKKHAEIWSWKKTLKSWFCDIVQWKSMIFRCSKASFWSSLVLVLEPEIDTVFASSLWPKKWSKKGPKRVPKGHQKWTKNPYQKWLRFWSVFGVPRPVWGVLQGSEPGRWGRTWGGGIHRYSV